MNSITASPRAIWQDHARKGELAYQWSPDARRPVFYPRLVCPHGGMAPLEWRVSAGKGAVYSITLTYPVEGDPYPVALVDLDEGFRMMSRVVGATGDPSEIGRRVTLRFVEEAGGDTPVAVFDWEDAA